MYQIDHTKNPDLIKDVYTFHKKFDLESRIINTPIDAERLAFRLKFLAEELQEINIAAGDGDLPGILDGLVDLVYVAIGTAYDLNLNFAKAWENVQAANLMKVKASEKNPSKRGHSNDIVKPANWQAPNHDSLFTVQDLNHDFLNSENYRLVELASIFE